MNRLTLFAALLSCTTLWAAEMPKPLAKEGVPVVADGYLVTLREPSVLTFQSRQQLAPAGKSLELVPTAPSAVKLPFNPDSGVVKAYRQYLRQRQDQILSDLQAKAGKSLRVVHRWDVVGNGFAVQVDAIEASLIAKHPEVAAVVPAMPRIPDDFATAQTLNAEPVWLGGIPTFSPTRGEGIVVGVIDTGVNPGHPAFAELAADGYRHTNPRPQRFGLCNSSAAALCNGKLIGIYDFGVGDSAFNGVDQSGHGTAVASRAVGNPVASTLVGPTTSLAATFTGVAPRAALISYRTPFTVPGAELAAINQAAIDRVDVLNMSFGSDSDDTPWQDPLAQAVLQARSVGIIPIVSTGNLGPDPRSVRRSPAYSPWVTSVAANRHNRFLQTRLANINGFGIATPFNLHGEAITSGSAEAELVLASSVTPNNAWCGTVGSDGAVSNPFPAGSLTGRIVLCEVGVYTLRAMSQHAKLAGAVGVVMLSHSGVGPGTVAEFLDVPGTLLNTEDSVRLRNLATAAAGAGQPIRARIEAVTIAPSTITGLLASYSSRGPVPQYGGVLKPNVAAPGPETWAASYADSGYLAFSGTSSAAPAAAGVAALIKAVHPNWSVDQVTSAMATTGVHGTSYSSATGVVPAGPLEDGGGMLNVAAATQAGLSFAVSAQEFRNADPDLGGNPEQLNLPALYTRRCLTECTFQRTVTANVSSTWVATSSFDARGQLTVSPAQLQLSAGQTGTFTVRIRLNDTLPIGTRLDGEVRWTSSTSNALAATVVPVSIERSVGDFSDIDLGVRPTVGTATVTTRRLSALDEVAWLQWPLRSMVPQRQFIANGSSHFVILGRPAALQGSTEGAGKIRVELSSATAPDVDLYLYEDLNNDGSGDRTVCVSNSTSSVERCEIDSVWRGSNSYIARVLSYTGSSTGDDVELVIYNEVPATQSQLVPSSGRGRNDADATLPLSLAWDMSAIPENAGAQGYISLRQAGQVLATARVKLTRAADGLAPIVLNSKSDRVVVTLEPGQAHERIIVDVPPNQSDLVLRAEATGGAVDLYASRASGTVTPPTFAPAPPRLQQPFVSASSGNSEVIGLEGSQVSAGRYYVTPVNNGTSTATVTLTTTGFFTSTSVHPRANGYFNPGRSGHGVFLATTPQVWALAWYTFDNAGKPIWYTAQGAAAVAGDGIWTAPLYRSTWNGQRDLPQEVGKVILTFDGQGSFTYSWKLDGQYGSEPFLPIGSPQCANGNLSVGGGWLRPDQSGWGSYFLNFAGNFEAEAIYVYDSDGLPRWVIGDGTYASTLQKTLYQVHGFCPTCAFAPTTRQQVGTASRTLNSTTQGRFSSQFTLTDGLSGTWSQQDVSWAKLTPDLSCQ